MVIVERRFHGTARALQGSVQRLPTHNETLRRQTMRGRSPRPVTTYGGQSFTAKEPVKRAVVVTGFEPAPAGSCVLCSTDELHNRAISTSVVRTRTRNTQLVTLNRDTARRRPGRCSSPESKINHKQKAPSTGSAKGLVRTRIHCESTCLRHLRRRGTNGLRAADNRSFGCV